jgi:anti-anti-sigma factor
MKFETERFICEIHDNVAHVRFKGPQVVEYSQACYLSPELRRVVSSYEFRLLVLDCEGLTFLTSTVLEAFVAAYLRCQKLGRAIRIVHADPLIRETLRTTQIDLLMPVHERLDEALKLD